MCAISKIKTCPLGDFTAVAWVLCKTYHWSFGDYGRYIMEHIINRKCDVFIKPLYLRDYYTLRYYNGYKPLLNFPIRNFRFEK